MKIAFVAVNYNNCWITTNYVSNIKAIHGYGKHDIEIVIVDNASQENDYKELKRQIEKETDVRLVHSEQNLGYFGGLNFGIKLLNYKDYDYIIAGNNDLFFSRDFFETLEKKKYGNKQTVIVPDLETISGVHQNPQFIDVPSAKRQLGYKVYYSCYLMAVIIDMLYKKKREKRMAEKKKADNQGKEIFQCTGALMLFRPEFFEHCGLLDDSLFLWGEEVALAHQLVEAGDKMYYDPDLKVIHMENASVGKIASYNKFKLWKKSYMVYKDYYYDKK